VTAGAAPPSQAHTFGSAGTFWFQAAYSGDANNNPAASLCSSGRFVVSPNSTTVSTQLSTAGPVAIGSSVTDQAALQGATAGAGGTVTYTAYANAACSVVVADLTPASNAVTGGVLPSSKALTLASGGTFYFQASYSGDSDNAPATSLCTDEQLVVSPNTPTVTTQLSKTGPVGTGASISEQAVLHGATGDAAGTIAYTLYGDSGCTTVVANLTPAVNAVAGGAAPASLAYTFLQAGTFWFQATYSGDASNAGPISSSCAAGQLTVSAPPSSAATPGGTATIGVTISPKLQTVSSGGTAVFTISVTNTGAGYLFGVGVADSLVPACARTSGGILDFDSMAPAVTDTYSCSVSGVSASFTNTVLATAQSSSGDKISATDSAAVTVAGGLTPPTASSSGSGAAARPRIAIAMTPKAQSRKVRVTSRKLANGKLRSTVHYPTATFRITVTNAGASTLANVRVADRRAPRCARLIRALAPGASSTYTCRRANVAMNFTNVATASGTVRGATVTASARATVKILTKTSAVHKS
jgi:hypothetical protein